jgi:uncharacterized repeat protein (TIGR01451 family)
VANVLGPIGFDNAAGGWTIVIAYKNPLLTPRNLTVFDGQTLVKSGGGNVDLSITGFLTPPSGAVTCELGAVVYDGDRSQPDAFSFKQAGAAGFYDLTPNATSNGSDMWNGTISYKGAVVTTRNPAYNNTLGYDADIIDLPNAGNAQLGNNKTSATVRFSSPSENYFISVMTTSILNYNPSFALQKTSTDLNGGTFQPGDIIRYTISYNNQGNDNSVNTKIVDSLPYNLSLVPGTIKINGVSKTDVAGDDEAYYTAAGRKIYFHVGTGANAASGGTVAIGSTGTVQFDAVAASSCRILTCGATVRNSARIEYSGLSSSQTLYDSSGVLSGGCLVQQGVSNSLSGTCYMPTDTTIRNNCSLTGIILPWGKYAGYGFYSAMPFTPANAFNPYNPVSTSGTYYAYFNSGSGCSDTVTINVIINICMDIDDDNDGIPDYVEIDNATALQDADGDGRPNWNDPDYAGYTDYNGDGYNDNFDPLADSDRDGVLNYMDADFSGFTDSNNDGVNDTMDKDLDGIPNNLDLDSDNDGIPDTVESFGVDANGDGIIDNYSDTDGDGFSQNVDGAVGVTGSGTGLGKIDTDSDGIPNYLDLDSDNDGIPDITEAFGTDTGNSARVDVFTDTDKDGLADTLDGDVGNDGTAENTNAALLRTGSDGNGDGRTDSWPYKNMDQDTKASPYDYDSDGDGLTDVREAQFTDANADGKADGSVNTDGRNITLAAMGAITIPNTDGNGRPNPYDIDADNDGIPDNVEGLTTIGYILPSGADTDGDGLDNAYDNSAFAGGNGIAPVDTDSDTVPDYLDADTDNDSMPDIIEGNDLNFNGRPDDGVALTGIDTDNDGLDDFFDASNSSSKATSRYMGNGGSTNGDLTPGSITTVQHTNVVFGCPSERDWRCIPYVLSCRYIDFRASLQNSRVNLDWKVICQREIGFFIIERSLNGTDFIPVITVPGGTAGGAEGIYATLDNVAGLAVNTIYYRLLSFDKVGGKNTSQIIAVRIASSSNSELQVVPNPVQAQAQVQLHANQTGVASFTVYDATGKRVYSFSAGVRKGNNTVLFNSPAALAKGIYFLKAQLEESVFTTRFSVQ